MEAFYIVCRIFQSKLSIINSENLNANLCYISIFIFGIYITNCLKIGWIVYGSLHIHTYLIWVHSKCHGPKQGIDTIRKGPFKNIKLYSKLDLKIKKYILYFCFNPRPLLLLLPSSSSSFSSSWHSLRPQRPVEVRPTLPS